MTKAKELTPTMKDAAARLERAPFERYQGGFWGECGRPFSAGGFHGTSTIEALVKRGIATYIDYKEGVRGKFPVRVELVKK